jgi:hypothetical protein
MVLRLTLIYLSLVVLAVLGLGADEWWIPGYEYRNENTNPRIVRPGDVIKLVVVNTDTLSGLWNVKSYSVTANPIKTGNQAEILWQPETVTTHHDHWDGSVAYRKNRFGDPEFERTDIWVEFTLPAREELSGHILEVNVNMDIERPLPKLKMDPFKAGTARSNKGEWVFVKDIFNLNESVSFKVITAEEKAIYERWSTVRTISGVIGSAALTILLLAVLLFLFLAIVRR